MAISYDMKKSVWIHKFRSKKITCLRFSIHFKRSQIILCFITVRQETSLAILMHARMPCALWSDCTDMHPSCRDFFLTAVPFQLVRSRGRLRRTTMRMIYSLPDFLHWTFDCLVRIMVSFYTFLEVQN